MREIDVHGMLHSDAITFVEDTVLEESVKYGLLFEVQVITGNSPRLQRRIEKVTIRFINKQFAYLVSIQ